MDTTAAAVSDLNQRTYNGEAGLDWLRRRYHLGLWDEDRELLMYLADPASTCLEVGPGSGDDASILAKNFRQYVGVDFAEEMLRGALALNPGPTYVCGNAISLPLSDNSVQVIYCAASVLHIPKAEFPNLLKEFRRVGANQTLGFISVKLGTRNGLFVEYAEDGTKYERWFSDYQPIELTSYLAIHGFAVFHMSTMPDPGNATKPPEEQVTWLKVLFRLKKDFRP